jgi:hypothetical protein
MTEALQIGIVTGAAGLALVALVVPLFRKRSHGKPPAGAPCAKCGHAQPRRRS